MSTAFSAQIWVLFYQCILLDDIIRSILLDSTHYFISEGAVVVHWGLWFVLDVVYPCGHFEALFYLHHVFYGISCISSSLQFMPPIPSDDITYSRRDSESKCYVCLSQGETTFFASSTNFLRTFTSLAPSPASTERVIRSYSLANPR